MWFNNIIWKNSKYSTHPWCWSSKSCSCGSGECSEAASSDSTGLHSRTSSTTPPGSGWFERWLHLVNQGEGVSRTWFVPRSIWKAVAVGEDLLLVLRPIQRPVVEHVGGKSGEKSNLDIGCGQYKVWPTSSSNKKHSLMCGNYNMKLLLGEI